MAGRLPRVTGATGVVDTADQGYFLGAVVFLGGGSGLAAAVVGSVDDVKVWQFVLPFRVVVRNIVVEVTTLDSGKKIGLGLYDASGNLYLKSGAISATSTGFLTDAITAVTVEPGVYFFAQTCDSTTVQVSHTTIPNRPTTVLNAQTVKKIGLAANSSSAGILPATLGTITASNISPAAVSFES